MDEREKRVLRLFGEIAAVAEQGGYTFQETTDALSRLSDYYEANGYSFLNSARILDVAQHRQLQYEKKTTALDTSTVAQNS